MGNDNYTEQASYKICFKQYSLWILPRAIKQ